MKSRLALVLVAGLVAAAALPVGADDDPFALSAEEAAAAEKDYQTHCALCHGKDREGYANDEAPSLRSESLMRSGIPIHVGMAIAYGRRGTPMGGYFEEIGGPFDRERLGNLITWLSDQSGVEPIDLPWDPVEGDVKLGRTVYEEHCALCHGANGEGALGPAVGNPSMLALTTDAFLRYAIENGRDGTKMPAFGEMLSRAEIDGVTAFLRSRASGWEVERPVLASPPPPEQWVLNADGAAPEFTLQDEMYVKAADLDQALRDKRRLVLLDTRVPSMWQIAHIEGSVPIPYYTGNFDTVAGQLPDEDTWIVTYCECPRAAAESVNRKLRAQGFKNTAVLWEGIQGWVSLGYPVSVGQTENASAQQTH